MIWIISLLTYLGVFGFVSVILFVYLYLKFNSYAEEGGL